jgi:HAD superfamily hydrolase (TIGR01509 family)
MAATLFDFNGVLVDDEHVHIASFREVLLPLGVTFDDATYTERYLAFDDAGAFRAMLADAGKAATEAEIARLIEAKKPVYMARIATDLVVFDGAAELVRRRARRGLVGIVSGALRHEIEHALTIMGVREAVAFIVAAEDTQACKPDPEGYVLGAAAVEARGGRRGEIVVIEDSMAGIEAARAVGLRCAGVAHSYAADRLREAGAAVVVERLALLTDALLDAGASREG